MRRTRFVIGAGFLAGAVVAMVWAGPAGAGYTVQPDLSAKAPGGSFAGNDVYNESGAGQEATAEVDFGETVKFRVRVQNDGNVPSVFKLRGEASAPGTRMRYFVGGQDVSRLMKHEGFFSPVILPGARIVVRAEATATDDQNDTDTFFVRGDSPFEQLDAFDVALLVVEANPL